MTITDKAIDKLIALRPNTDHVLNVSIQAGGCSGLGYHMEWVHYKTRADILITCNNLNGAICVTMDKKSALFLDSVTLDYEDGLNGKGFVWNNEKAKRTCGCGQSFSN